ncbi:MAG TPA: hypothetical protein VFZ58_02635 [Candidatus Saccharimonadales bacterium]
MDPAGEGLTLLVGCFALLVGSVWCLRQIYKLVRHEVSHYGPLFMLGTGIYILGLGFKYTVIGPAPLRFYLSDFGAPFMAGYVFFRPMWWSEVKSSYYEKLDWDKRWYLKLGYYRTTLIIGFCLAMIYELAAGYMHGRGRAEKQLKAMGVGHFEWWDVLCYVLALVVGLVILHLWRRQIQRDKLFLDEIDAAEAVLEKAKKREDQKQRRNKRQARQPKRKRRR